MRLPLLCAVTALVSALLPAMNATARQPRGTPGAPNAIQFPNARLLPVPSGRFEGVIAPSARDSTPAWPPALGAPDGAPTVLVMLTDDVGFGAPATFGSIIETLRRLSRVTFDLGASTLPQQAAH